MLLKAIRHRRVAFVFLTRIYLLNIANRFFFLAKRFTIFLFLAIASLPACAQYPQFSFATDLGVQRNFKQEQKYWSVGQTVQALFHFTPKDGVYVWFCYYTNGKFKNDVTAVAHSPATIPQQFNYTNSAKMRLKHFSIGWKKYLKGSSDAEKNWNLYTYGGFGLLLGRVDNVHSVSIDTALYNAPVLSGKANFKRLTLDVGLGWEIPIGGDFYFYNEARVWIPTTDYPSKYIFVNNNAPLVAMMNIGLRLLF